MPSFIPDPTAERAAVIDHAALAHNVSVIREWVKPAQLMAVVKADAYGHGSVEVARTAVAAGANWLGTAHVREALKLRQAGITESILAWLHTIRTPFAEAIESNIDLGVSGAELVQVIDAAKKVGKPARIHLKIDTGLNRHGAALADWEELCKQAGQAQINGHVRVVGVFTHFAMADDPAAETVVDDQLEKYHKAVEIARKHGCTVDIRHVANSPALLSRPDTHLDMVRAGVAIYGLSPFSDRVPADFDLRPVMSVRTYLANSKPTNTGEGVSYGHLYRTTDNTRLGVVPLGYADGVPRTAIGGPVSVNGKTYTVSGRIAMDQFVVDFHTEHDDDVAPVGSEVELFGQSSGILVSEWANAAGTINYEIVTRIGARVPRVHIDGTTGEVISTENQDA